MTDKKRKRREEDKTVRLDRRLLKKQGKDLDSWDQMMEEEDQPMPEDIQQQIAWLRSGSGRDAAPEEAEEAADSDDPLSSDDYEELLKAIEEGEGDEETPLEEEAADSYEDDFYEEEEDDSYSEESYEEEDDSLDEEPASQRWEAGDDWDLDEEMGYEDEEEEEEDTGAYSSSRLYSDSGYDQDFGDSIYGNESYENKAANRVKTTLKVVLAILVAFLAIVLIWRILDKKSVPLDPSQGSQSVAGDLPSAAPASSASQAGESGKQAGGAGSESGNGSDSQTGSGDTSLAAGDSSSSQEELPVVTTGLFAGQAMPNANTGDFVQDQRGRGKNHNAAAGVYAYPVTDVKAAMQGKKKLQGAHKIAFLTYDDGVSNNCSPTLLDNLKAEGVPATFFIKGYTVTANTKAIMERMMKEGHAIGMHSYSHEYGVLYPNRHADAQAIAKEYEKGLAACRAQLGEEFDSKVWRYPGGHMSWKDMKPADEALAAKGVGYIDWNSTNNDAAGKKSQPKNAQEAIDNVFKGWGEWGNPNTIVILMHDLPEKKVTRESVHELVQALRQEGFSFGIME